MMRYYDDYREKDCPDCGGTGYDPYDGGQCDRCNGTGTICYNASTGEEY